MHNEKKLTLTLYDISPWMQQLLQILTLTFDLFWLGLLSVCEQVLCLGALLLALLQLLLGGSSDGSLHVAGQGLCAAGEPTSCCAVAIHTQRGLSTDMGCIRANSGFRPY